MAKAAEDEPMPAQGRFANRPHHRTKQLAMNEKEIEKELRRLPDEWVKTFLVRVIVASILGQVEKIKPDKHLFTCFSKEIDKYNLFSVLRNCVITDCCHNKIKLYFSSSGERICIKHNTNTTTLLDNDCFLFYTSENYSCILFGEANDWDDFKNIYVHVILTAQLAGIDITNELTFLKNYINSGKTVVDYLYQPLYASQNTKLLQLGNRFVKALRDIGSGFDIWAEWFQGRIDGVPTNEEFLKNVIFIPEEILSQEPAHINAYLKSLGNAAGALNRVRVIFLGYGEAGKTSLIRALNGLEVVAGKEQMTPGIDISTWQMPGTEITAHFWDFGGQVVAHATHQFFLRSRCLYILLLDGRTEINANEQAEYWLEHVRAFGSKAPVMLVGNKADLCAVNLDMAALKEKHENVLDFYPLSCTKYQEEYAAHFQRFQADLIKQVAELGVHTVRFGKAHLAVLDELTNRSSTESFLKKTEWLDLCQGSGLAEQGFSCRRE